MLIEVHAQTGNTVYCQAAHIVAIDIPSVISPEAQCRVIVLGPIMIGVTYSEAERVRDLLIALLSDVAVKH